LALAERAALVNLLEKLSTARGLGPATHPDF
jgi:hypothetical protein